MVVPGWLSLTADIATLAGVLVTVSVWIQTRAIKKSFVSKARLPELSKSLREICAKLLENLQEPDAAVARLDGLLISILPKVDRPQRRIVLSLRKKCRQRANGPFPWAASGKRSLSESEVWALYTEAQGLLEALSQAVRDSKWS